MVDLKSIVRDVPDFPQKGILFKDITPILNHATAFSWTTNQLAERYRDAAVDVIAGIESRGFIFGAALASKMNLPFVPIRKPGKLPYNCIRESYQLEYGIDALEIHEDAFKPGDRVLLVDDVLATGGTALAAIRLIERGRAVPLEFAFVIELAFLKGRERLLDRKTFSLVSYD
jgi:adenine phosphoribosyltransferase